MGTHSEVALRLLSKFNKCFGRTVRPLPRPREELRPIWFVPIEITQVPNRSFDSLAHKQARRPSVDGHGRHWEAKEIPWATWDVETLNNIEPSSAQIRVWSLDPTRLLGFRPSQL